MALIDIFPPSTAIPPRGERPILHKARLTWARMRLVGGAQRTVGGIGEGDRVRVLVSPGRWRSGVLKRWERGADTGSLVLISLTVGFVELDLGDNIRAPRTRITPAFAAAEA